VHVRPGTWCTWGDDLTVKSLRTSCLASLQIPAARQSEVACLGQRGHDALHVERWRLRREAGHGRQVHLHPAAVHAKSHICL
jgi:hypothetical protein